MADSLPTDINLNLQGVLRIEEDGILEWRKTTGDLLKFVVPVPSRSMNRQVHIPLSQLIRSNIKILSISFMRCLDEVGPGTVPGPRCKRNRNILYCKKI